MSRVKDLIKRVSICAVLFAAVLPMQHSKSKEKQFCRHNAKCPNNQQFA